MADIGIVVVGERPYAEGHGDQADLSLSSTDIRLINRIRPHTKKLIVILLSGRPLIIGPQLNQSDAFVAAWLPGTEGQGVADVLFGDKPFTGKLSFTWPRTMTQVPLSAIKSGATGCDAPLFPFGYGLDTANKATVTDTCITGS
jgi:beta-glucosidase